MREYLHTHAELSNIHTLQLCAQNLMQIQQHMGRVNISLPISTFVIRCQVPDPDPVHTKGVDVPPILRTCLMPKNIIFLYIC